MMRINEVAKLTGVTARTLHYYDEIGLLTPREVTEAGYRLYSGENLRVLQQILFYRELGFPLAKIKEIMDSPGYDRRIALKGHRALLLKERERLDGLIALVDKSLKGEGNMSFTEFDRTEIERTKEQYAAEARERWGQTDAYRQSEKKTKNLTPEQWNNLYAESDAILREFGENRTLAPGGEQARALVKKWQMFISERFYDCPDEMLACLGQMYTADGRFTQNLDKYGEGTAAFMADAIARYCAK